MTVPEILNRDGMVGTVQIRAGVLEAETGKPTRRLRRGHTCTTEGSQETLAQRPCAHAAAARSTSIAAGRPKAKPPGERELDL